MFFGTKLIEYQASFDDLLNLWCFYSITAPHYENYSTSEMSYISKTNKVNEPDTLTGLMESCSNKLQSLLISHFKV